MLNHGLTDKELRIISETLAPFAQTIRKAGLFGSRATGKAKPYSDIDLVLYGSLGDNNIRRIHTLFQDSYLPVKVDVVAYDAVTNPLLKQHIDAVMQPLFTQQELMEQEQNRCPKY